MTVLKRQLLIVALFGPIGCQAAPILCTAGTAADYTALGSTGCMDSIGAVISNFAFSDSGNPVVPLSSIMISPFASTDLDRISGLKLTMSPAVLLAPSTNYSISVGATITLPPDIPFTSQSMASWSINWISNLITPPALPVPRSDRTMLTEDGKLIWDEMDGPFGGFGLSGFITAGSSVSILVNYSLSIPASDQGVLSGFQFDVLTPKPIPEPATWILNLALLCLAARFRRRIIPV